MRNAKEYRNIVFDMGGVLVDYTADNATWHYTDDPEIVREIHNVMFCSQEWMALDMGAMTDEQAIKRILPRLSSGKVREIALITFEHWHEYNNVARSGMDQIIRSLKARGQRVYILPMSADALRTLIKMWSLPRICMTEPSFPERFWL